MPGSQLAVTPGFWVIDAARRGWLACKILATRQKWRSRSRCENEAISTSGDYERFFEQDGERFHHIIVPSTGTPAGEVHSATIIGPDAVITDALSTSVFVMGVDQGLRLIATLAGLRGNRHRFYWRDVLLGRPATS